MRTLKLWIANFRTGKSRSLFQKAVGDLTRANQNYISEVSILNGEIVQKQSHSQLLQKQIEANQKLAVEMAKLLQI